MMRFVYRLANKQAPKKTPSVGTHRAQNIAQGTKARTRLQKSAIGCGHSHQQHSAIKGYDTLRRRLEHSLPGLDKLLKKKNRQRKLRGRRSVTSPLPNLERRRNGPGNAPPNCTGWNWEKDAKGPVRWVSTGTRDRPLAGQSINQPLGPCNKQGRTPDGSASPAATASGPCHGHCSWHAAARSLVQAARLVCAEQHRFQQWQGYHMRLGGDAGVPG